MGLLPDSFKLLKHLNPNSELVGTNMLTNTTFTGSTITTDATIDAALQELETAVELRQLAAPAAEFDMGANSIGFTLQTATGDGTTTIDWGAGNHFAFTFGAQNETFTFTAPTNPGYFTLSLLQDSVGSRTATWPATVEWAGGSAPTLTTTATTGKDLVTFLWDGTAYQNVSVIADLS